jgi:hypothetical protein
MIHLFMISEEIYAFMPKVFELNYQLGCEIAIELPSNASEGNFLFFQRFVWFSCRNYVGCKISFIFAFYFRMLRRDQFFIKQIVNKLSSLLQFYVKSS